MKRGFVLSRLLILMGSLWLVVLAVLAATFAALVLRPFVQMPEAFATLLVVWGVAVALVLAPVGVWMIRVALRWRRRKKQKIVI
jgi:hypothetical protein